PEHLDGEVAMNCRFRSFQGWIGTRPEQADGQHAITITARDPKLAGVRAEIPYQLSREAAPPPPEDPLPMLQMPMSTADALSQRYSYLPVAAKGPGWVMFDLRKFK